MKKFLAVFLTVAVFISLFSSFACAENVTLPGGYIEDNTYYSPDAGLKFKCPDGWSFDSAEDIAKSNEITVDEMSDADVVTKLLEAGKDVSMITASDGTGFGIPSTITMSCKALSPEEIEELKELGEDAFLDQSLEMSDMSASEKGVTIKNMQFGKYTFLGEETPMLSFTLKFMVVISRQVNIVMFLRNDRIYTVMIMADKDGLKYLDMFEAI